MPLLSAIKENDIRSTAVMSWSTTVRSGVFAKVRAMSQRQPQPPKAPHNLDTFHLFPNLPQELQDKIWEAAVCDPRDRTGQSRGSDDHVFHFSALVSPALRPMVKKEEKTRHLQMERLKVQRPWELDVNFGLWSACYASRAAANRVLGISPRHRHSGVGQPTGLLSVIPGDRVIAEPFQWVPLRNGRVFMRPSTDIVVLYPRMAPQLEDLKYAMLLLQFPEGILGTRTMDMFKGLKELAFVYSGPDMVRGDFSVMRQLRAIRRKFSQIIASGCARNLPERLSVIVADPWLPEKFDRSRLPFSPYHPRGGFHSDGYDFVEIHPMDLGVSTPCITRRCSELLGMLMTQRARCDCGKVCRGLNPEAVREMGYTLEAVQMCWLLKDAMRGIVPTPENTELSNLLSNIRILARFPAKTG